MINNSKQLQLRGIGYKEMAGTYKCIATGIGGQNSGNSTLEVYCKYFPQTYRLIKSCFLNSRH